MLPSIHCRDFSFLKLKPVIACRLWMPSMASEGAELARISLQCHAAVFLTAAKRSFMDHACAVP